MSKFYLAVLIFTFSSGFGGIGYREFASKMFWPVGSSWGKSKINILCFLAMVIAVVGAWQTYGLLTVCAVVLVGAFFAFTLAILIKQRVQILNLIGITAGSALSLVGSFVIR